MKPQENRRSPRIAETGIVSSKVSLFGPVYSPDIEYILPQAYFHVLFSDAVTGFHTLNQIDHQLMQAQHSPGGANTIVRHNIE
jgi:hypothetical protein